MTDEARAEAEWVWQRASDAFFAQQERTGDGAGAAIPVIAAALAAARRGLQNPNTGTLSDDAFCRHWRTRFP